MAPITMRKNDEGTKIVISLTEIVNGAVQAFDLTGATTTTIKFRKPGGNGTILEEIAVIESPPTAGQISYTTVTGFLDTVGEWDVFGYVENPSGKWHSHPGFIHVEDIITVP